MAEFTEIRKESHKIKEESNKARYDFVVAELDLALTFVGIAKSSERKARRSATWAMQRKRIWSRGDFWTMPR